MYDFILLGGGLASGLLAYRLKTLKPELRVLVIEQTETLGGNHTWSFHTSDLTESQMEWISPLISKSWDRYTVQFPAFSRVFHSGYHSIGSEKFHQVIAPVLGKDLLLRKKVKSFSYSKVTLTDDQAFESHCVLDGRGFTDFAKDLVGYQKFVGLDITLESPHGLEGPILKDVNCIQEDGYRFFYLLPWSEKSLLIEDTRYSDTGDVNRKYFISEIEKYVEKKGWKIASIDREEVGSLPIPMFKDYALRDASDPEMQIHVPKIGVRSGCFHMVTGYSLPVAARIADAIANLPKMNTLELFAYTQKFYSTQQSNYGFYRLLNRMLFLAANPEQRFKVLQRFYRLPEPLIERFYADTLKISDYMRILMGRPPVPIQQAMKCLLERKERNQIENGRHEVKIPSRN